MLQNQESAHMHLFQNGNNHCNEEIKLSTEK